MPEMTTATIPEKITKLTILEAWVCNDVQSVFDQLNAVKIKKGLTTADLMENGIRLHQIKDRAINISRKKLDHYMDVIVDDNFIQYNDNAQLYRYIRETSGFKHDYEFILETGVSVTKLYQRVLTNKDTLPELNDEEFLIRMEAEWPDMTPIIETIMANSMDIEKLCRDIDDWVKNQGIYIQESIPALLCEYMMSKRRMPSPMYDYIINDALPKAILPQKCSLPDYEAAKRALIMAILHDDRAESERIFEQISKKVITVFKNMGSSSKIPFNDSKTKTMILIEMAKRFDDIAFIIERKFRIITDICYDMLINKKTDMEKLKKSIYEQDKETTINEMLSPLHSLDVSTRFISKMGSGDPDSLNSRKWKFIRATSLGKELEQAEAIHEILMNFAVKWIAQYHKPMLLQRKEN